MSKGLLFNSAVEATRKTKKPKGWKIALGIIFNYNSGTQLDSNCRLNYSSTTSLNDNDPAIITTPAAEIPIGIS